MREEDLRKLEFEKILSKLREFVHSPATEKLLESLRPSTNREEVVSLIELFTSFRDIDLRLYRFEDIREPLQRARIEGAFLTVEELLSIQSVLRLIREVRKVIGEEAERKPPLRKLSKRLHLFSSLENLIESSIDRRGFVKDEASEELLRIRKNIRGVEKEIMERLESLLRRPDADKLFSDKIITLRNNRYVVPVKSSQMKGIFGIVHGTSSSGYTTYVEPQFVVELNNRLTELKGEEEEEVRRILRRITSYVGDFAPKILESFQALTEIDLLLAKKRLGETYGGGFPELGDHVELRNVKHPILALINPEAVPVDIILKDRKGLILTGPNTGGKTVALKTLGLVSLMVQSGIPVPVGDGSVLRVFENVFVDIGDEQSLEQNLSTFSSHMTNLASFLEKTGPSTLVLLDELGAGTDPVEGSALGIGILEYLRGKEAWVFANTHHTPIKTYALNSDYFTVASVLFDRETLKPLYRIAYNAVGESMAFEVAKRCGIPEEVLEVARRNLGDRGEEYMSAMEKLADYTREYEEKLAQLESLKEELQKEKERYEELHRRYTELRRRGWKEAYAEARNYLKRLMEEGEKLLKNLRSKEELEGFLRQQERQLELFLPVEERDSLKVGEKVEFMGKRGKVLQIKEGKAYVALEGKKVWVDLRALRKAEGEEKERRVPRTSLTKSEVNLIGMDASAALIELERFLEEAYASGLKRVKIIHGVGKGVLKQAVQDFLSKSERVKFYREAYPHEGGSGVTVAFLRGPDE